MKKILLYCAVFILMVGLVGASLSLAGCKSNKSQPKSGKPAPTFPKY